MNDDARNHEREEWQRNVTRMSNNRVAQEYCWIIDGVDEDNMEDLWTDY
jgi:hypothetical protein